MRSSSEAEVELYFSTLNIPHCSFIQFWRNWCTLKCHLNCWSCCEPGVLPQRRWHSAVVSCCARVWCWFRSDGLLFSSFQQQPCRRCTLYCRIFLSKLLDSQPSRVHCFAIDLLSFVTSGLADLNWQPADLHFFSYRPGRIPTDEGFLWLFGNTIAIDRWEPSSCCAFSGCYSVVAFWLWHIQAVGQNLAASACGINTTF